MGCDIHFYVEHKDADGKWRSSDKWSDPYGEGENTVAYKDRFFTGRNYTLFSMLAGVRNYHDIVPIHDPRGVPEDACEEVKDESDRWGCDGHSHSHATLKELLEYDWTRIINMSGVVDLREWARWRDKGEPDGWCRYVGGGDTVMVTPEEIEAAWQKVREEFGHPEERCASVPMRSITGRGLTKEEIRMNELLGGTPYTSVEWEVPYHKYASDFFGNVVPRLLRLAMEHGGMDNVRVVYFFDN